MNDMQRYGALLRSRREALGLTSEKVGEMLGRPGSYVSRYERGVNSVYPDPFTLREFGRVLGVSMRSSLEALGYLDPDVPEPGITHVVREGDPRGRLLDLLTGLSDRDLDMVIALVGLISTHAGDSNIDDAGVRSNRIADDGDAPQYG